MHTHPRIQIITQNLAKTGKTIWIWPQLYKWGHFLMTQFIVALTRVGIHLSEPRYNTNFFCYYATGKGIGQPWYKVDKYRFTCSTFFSLSLNLSHQYSFLFSITCANAPTVSKNIKTRLGRFFATCKPTKTHFPKLRADVTLYANFS